MYCLLKVLSLFALANNILQATNTDLSPGMTLEAACVENVHNFRPEHKFCNVWDEVVTKIDAHLRRTRRDNTLLQAYVVKKTTRNNEMNKGEMPRLFYSTLDQVINKIRCAF